MRHWLFHPLVFYPLALLIGAFVIVVSLQPQAWPREPAPVAATRVGEWLVFQGEAFNSPSVDAQQQEMTVPRDFFGRARALNIAQKPSAPLPTPEDQGARILLSPEDAAALAGRPVTIEVSYNPLPINAATGLAVSLRGEGPSAWVSQPAPPQSATLRFQLPAQSSVSAIGLRALSDGTDQAYGLEITRIRLAPHA
jgi:hypothetical protein